MLLEVLCTNTAQAEKLCEVSNGTFVCFPENAMSSEDNCNSPGCYITRICSLFNIVKGKLTYETIKIKAYTTHQRRTSRSDDDGHFWLFFF